MSRIRFIALLLSSSVVLAACGGSSPSGSGTTAGGKPTPANLQLWVGGNFAGATPGTPYRTWLDDQIARFKHQHPGSNVTVTLLSTNNEVVAAKLQAAFTAHAAPDMLLFYSGGYTTPYIPELLPLNKFFAQTPGLFNNFSGMDLSCANLNCEGGKGQIYAVPIDWETYGIFYNKADLAKAGVSVPIKTWPDLLSACGKLKKIGVIPIAYGDQSGYSTDNWLTLMYGSSFAQGDIAAVNDGKLPYTSPKLVQPLQTLTELRTHGCVNASFATAVNGQDDVNLFMSKKAAMVLTYPTFIPNFEKALGKNLGVMAIPPSSNGPLAGQPVGNSFYNWVITKQSANQQLAWDFIKIATDTTAEGQVLTILGTPPARTDVSGNLVSDAVTRFFLDQARHSAMPLLDSVIPVSVALYYYKEIEQAFSGQVSPLAAMQAVNQKAPSLATGP